MMEIIPFNARDVNDEGQLCREHIICPLFLVRDLSGLGWAIKEGHYDTGEDATAGETDAV